MSYNTQSAVLLLVYNRPDFTRQVFNAVKLAAPAKLYIAADGAPHDGHQKSLCNEVKLVVEDVDWPCRVKNVLSG